MITHPAAPGWASCVLDSSHTAAIEAWLKENKSDDQLVHTMQGNKQVYVMFKDEALAALFKLVFVDFILPE